MDITEVKVRLAEDRTERLRAFCTVTFDREFVVRDIKIIEGAKGLFVAMPSRKVTDHCPKCKGKNHLRARYCNDCGAALPGQRAPDLSEGSSKLHVDVAHPINSECRGRLQKAIVVAYHEEADRAKASGYAAPSLDSHDTHAAPPKEATEPAPAAEEAPAREGDPSAPSRPDEKPFGAGLL